MIVAPNMILFKATETIALQCIYSQQFIVKMFKHTDTLKYFTVNIYTYHLDSTVNILLYLTITYLTVSRPLSLCPSVWFVIHFKMSCTHHHTSLKFSSMHTIH